MYWHWCRLVQLATHSDPDHTNLPKPNHRDKQMRLSSKWMKWGLVEQAKKQKTNLDLL